MNQNHERAHGFKPLENKQELEIIEELTIKKNVIGKIASFFIDRKEISILLMVLVVSLGIIGVWTLPKESLPEIVFPTINVRTLYPGASVSDVEKQVTVPLENVLSKLDDVAGIESVSNEGFSLISVTFTEGVDMDRKQLEVNGAISGLVLPDAVLDPTAFVFKTSEIPLISISLKGEDILNLTAAGEDLKSSLEALSGVEEVKLFGTANEEIQILVDETRLLEEGLTLDQLSSAIRMNDIALPIGSEEIDGIKYNVRIDQNVNDLEDFLGIPLVTKSGTIQVGDLARVEKVIKTTSVINRSYTNDGTINTSIYLEVLRKNGADVLSTSDDVKNFLIEYKPVLDDRAISYDLTKDTAKLVREDLGNIVANALSGLLVVTLVLFLFIGFREALIVSITIPLTLLATVATLSIFGISLNTFAILGLIVALGLLVDNAIIVMENMTRIRAKGATYKEAALYGVNQVGFPIASATLTTVAAFFPLAILPGIIGAFINTIPRTIIMALTLSFIFAISITPSVYVMVNRFTKEVAKDRKAGSNFKKIGSLLLKIGFVSTLSILAFSGEGVALWVPILATTIFVVALIVKEQVFKGSLEDTVVIRTYHKIMLKILSSRWKMAALIVTSFIILGLSMTLITSGQLKVAFFPQTEPASLTINLTGDPAIGLDQMSSYTSKVEDLLMNLNISERFTTTIGSGGSNLATINVDLVDNDQSGFDQLALMRNELLTIEDLKIEVVPVAAGGPPVGKAIEIGFYGDNLGELKEAADYYQEVLGTQKGVINIEASVNDGPKVKVFELDSEKTAELGLTPMMVATSLRTLKEGLIATTYSDGPKTLDVRLMYKDGDQVSLSKRYLSTMMGTSVMVGEIGQFKTQDGLSSIVRKDQVRNITVTADLEPGYNATEVLESFKDQVKAYPLSGGLRVDYDGEASSISSNFTNLLKSMILAMFLVFAILTIQFGSIKQPLIILTTIPMALIGVLYGLTLTNNEFGFYAFMALVSLVGIAVNDAIVLIDYANYLRSEGRSALEAIAEAGRTRFNPVLSTSLTTIGGILPLAFKNAYYSQFGYALIFGLLMTTLMTLVLIPIGYRLSSGEKVQGIKEEKGEKREKLIPKPYNV